MGKVWLLVLPSRFFRLCATSNIFSIQCHTKYILSIWLGQLSRMNERNIDRKVRMYMNATQFVDYIFIWIMFYTSQNSFNKWHKISSREIGIFGLKVIVKSGLEFFIWKFTEPLQSCCCPVQKICPVGLNWPGRLAGISEGARSISK